jgi:hypothetical protein
VVRWVPMVEIVGPDSQRKSKSVRLGEAARGHRKLGAKRAVTHHLELRRN